MNIGTLALLVALVCAVITLAAPPKERVHQTVDYNKIYEAMAPREI